MALQNSVVVIDLIRYSQLQLLMPNYYPLQLLRFLNSNDYDY